MARGFHTGSAGDGPIIIGDLTNTEYSRAAAASSYGCRLKVNTNGKKIMTADSYTGTDYNGTALNNSVLTITGNISGQLYNSAGAFTAKKTFSISSDEYITIQIDAMHMPNGSNYSQTLANITLE